MAANLFGVVDVDGLARRCAEADQYARNPFGDLVQVVSGVDLPAPRGCLDVREPEACEVGDQFHDADARAFGELRRLVGAQSHEKGSGVVVGAAPDPYAGGQLSGEIAANAPLSLSGNKRIIRALREGPLSEGQERELVELRESCFRREDFREGVRAFGEKRSPEWKGR